MPDPKVSVIISTYKRPKLLQRAIESVVNQTYPDWELIVVDDCSPEPSWTPEFEKECDERIKLIRLDKNTGSQARPKNTGVLASKGEYICFLDDDNAFKPDHIATLLRAIEQNPDVAVVYGDRYMIFEANPQKNNVGVFSEFDSGILMSRNFIDTSDFMIRRADLFEIGGWDEGHKRMLDWNLMARLDKAGKKFLHVPIIVTDYYVHKDGMLSDKDPDENEWFVIPTTDGTTFGATECEIVLPYLGERPQPRIAIFTITWNRLELTKLSFESLRETAGYEFDHYIVDNGSTDGTQKWLRDYQNKHNGVHLLLNEDNKGIAIASNQILKEIRESSIKYDLIGKFDNDAICKNKGWLKAMVEIYKVNRKIAMSCFITGLKDSAGGVPRYFYGMVKGELIGMTKHLGGICYFTHADIRLQFHLDEDETLHTMDDLIFSRYIQERGYQLGYLENYYISHGTGGTEQIYKDYPEYYKKYLEAKTKRYGQD